MTISELLEAVETNIEAIEKMPDKELALILAPYFPMARTPILPKEKAAKTTAENSLFKSLLAANADTINKMRKARE